jgi:hypothetical protein
LGRGKGTNDAVCFSVKKEKASLTWVELKMRNEETNTKLFKELCYKRERRCGSVTRGACGIHLKFFIVTLERHQLMIKA